MRRIKLILVIVSALISACPDAGATRPVKFRYGAEWGIGVNMLSAINGSYITEEGYLVESDELKHSCHANGCVYAFAGAEISRSLGIRLYSGYMGLTRKERVIPVSMRILWNFNGNAAQTSSSMFAEAGAGFRKGFRTSAVGKLGYSYRYRLSGHAALELNAGGQVSYSHPYLYDKYSGHYVTEDKLGISRSLNAGIFMTIGLIF